jgi:hypothetical protein
MRILLVTLVGCGGGFGGPNPQGQDLEVENAGRMCLHASPPDPFLTPGPQSFASATPITVTVELRRCLSSSCDIDPAMTCAIAPITSGLAVTSLATWTRTDDEACTDDCGQLAATCTTEPLPAGTFDFLFGGQTLALTVPSDTGEPPCLDVPE